MHDLTYWAIDLRMEPVMPMPIHRYHKLLPFQRWIWSGLASQIRSGRVLDRFVEDQQGVRWHGGWISSWLGWSHHGGTEMSPTG